MDNNQKVVNTNEVNAKDTNTKEKKQGFFKLIVKENGAKVAIALSIVSIVLSIITLCVTLSHKRTVDRHVAFDDQHRIEREYPGDHGRFGGPSGPSRQLRGYMKGGNNLPNERPDMRKRDYFDNNGNNSNDSNRNQPKDMPNRNNNNSNNNDNKE